MIVFHGSDMMVERPEILQSNRLLDFGVGFYTTSNREQAVRWAERVCARNKSKCKYLSTYQFDVEKAKQNIVVLEFKSSDEEWLDFIIANRSGKSIEKEYDIVIGPVADDNVYLTVKLFETGVLNKEETIKRLKIEKLFDQIMFHTERSLIFCDFYDSISLGD